MREKRKRTGDAKKEIIEAKRLAEKCMIGKRQGSARGVSGL